MWETAETQRGEWRVVRSWAEAKAQRWEEEGEGAWAQEEEDRRARGGGGRERAKRAGGCSVPGQRVGEVRLQARPGETFSHLCPAVAACLGITAALFQRACR